MKLFGTLFLSVFVLASCQKQDFFTVMEEGRRLSNLFRPSFIYIIFGLTGALHTLQRVSDIFNQINEKQDASVIGYHFDRI